jgi:cobalt-zinc-cadmium efflux system membrane fusion protein
MTDQFNRYIMLAAALAVSVILGCSQPAPPAADTSSTSTVQATNGGEAGHDHSGWWCTEHGVPEEVCGQCNAKLAADFQQKGDWCKQHDRPDSQCFVCHPELAATFAARYEAKYGQQPPKME